jgi:hypothetical protein
MGALGTLPTPHHTALSCHVMGLVIRVKGDFSRADVRLVEEYVKMLVTSATGEPVARAVTHGVVKTDIDALRESFALGGRTSGR